MKYKKILVIRLLAIGDVVHTTVAPQAIKAKYPECEIHYLTTIHNSIMLQDCPYIDKIIIHNNFSDDISSTVKKIRSEKYDAILCLNLTSKIIKILLMCLPVKIVFRGFKGASWVENYFYTAKKLFKDIELPDKLHFEPSDKGILREIQDLMDKYPKPHIILNPGKLENNARAGRVWNIEKYKELSQALLKKYGGSIFINGDKGERNYHSVLQSDNVHVFSGDFEMKQLCSFLSLGDIVISGDSGPAHIASAYGVNTVAILGSTSPDKIKPYGNNGYFIGPKTKCKYCWKKKCKYTKSNSEITPCIDSIEVADVMKLIECNNLL